MDAFPRIIDYYETADGKKPFIEWIEEQEDDVRHRINTRFLHVEKGNFGDHHKEGGGVFALIFNFGPGYRVYYALTEEQKVVLLLVGGTKKRQSKDIETAIEYWGDFKSRPSGEKNS
jgi:putative addiction module killer protein